MAPCAVAEVVKLPFVGYRRRARGVGSFRQGPAQAHVDRVAVVGQECGADIKPMPSSATQSRTGWPCVNFPISGAYGGGGVVDFHIELVALVIAMWTQRELGAVAGAIDKVPRKLWSLRRDATALRLNMARTRARRHMDGL